MTDKTKARKEPALSSKYQTYLKSNSPQSQNKTHKSENQVYFDLSISKPSRQNSALTTHYPKSTYEKVLKRQSSAAGSIHTLKDRRLQGKSMIERIIQIQYDVWITIQEANKDQLVSQKCVVA